MNKRDFLTEQDSEQKRFSMLTGKMLNIDKKKDEGFSQLLNILIPFLQPMIKSFAKNNKFAFVQIVFIALVFLYLLFAGVLFTINLFL